MEPDAALELEFVYGYNGVTNTAPNLFFTGGDGSGGGSGGGQVAYYTAAVGVVYDRRTDTQRHFLGHTKVGEERDGEALALFVPPPKRVLLSSSCAFYMYSGACVSSSVVLVRAKARSLCSCVCRYGFFFWWGGRHLRAKVTYG